MTHSASSLTSRCGLVAVIGFPNAGKSTLLNALVGQKVSIVSHKVQTTRNRVLGIALHQDSQIILIDTPGILENPQKRLEKAMAIASTEAPKEGDMTLLIVDVTNPSKDRYLALLKKLQDLTIPVWVVLNKIDRMKREQLLEWAGFFGQHAFVEQIFMVSALTKDGTMDLLDALSKKMPPGPWLFPEDQVSTAPQRLLAAEITREVMFRFLHQEIPYISYVETEAWETFRNGSLKISQVIHVVKETQKAIVLGHHGQTIKKLSTIARQELSELFETPVHLFLHVCVTPDWMEKTHFYTLMGLNFEKGIKKKS